MGHRQYLGPADVSALKELTHESWKDIKKKKKVTEIIRGCFMVFIQEPFFPHVIGR